LDEPTNHLDSPAAEILEEALVSFEGTVIFISHDRRFLENVATRIVSVRDGKVEIASGGFRDYMASHRRTEERPVIREEKATKKTYEEQKQAARDKEKRKRRIAELENAIAVSEAELDVLRESLKADPGGDWTKLAEMAEREQDLARKVEAMMAEWAKLSEEDG
jgi:ATP-binding cassette subfamily F protein 3